MQDDKSLLYACVVNDMALIKQRLENVKPAQLKKSTQETGTPLHAAAHNENTEAIDLLVESGANIEAGNFLGNNAMLACIAEGRLDIAKHLIERGSAINKKGCQNRGALSQLILYSWDRNFAEYLIQKGFDLHQTAIDGISLLCDAASSDNGDAIDFLLQHGVDRSCFNSALCWAIIHNSVHAVQLLLDRGASLDEMFASCKGIEKGLYHRALKKQNAGDLIRLLLKHGIDFSKTPERAVVVDIEKTKLSPLDYAKESLQKWPNATHIADNINIVEAHLGR